MQDTPEGETNYNPQAELEARIGEAVRDLTKTMPMPVAKSYARKIVNKLLDTQARMIRDLIPGSLDEQSGDEQSGDEKYAIGFNTAVSDMIKNLTRWTKGGV